MDDAAAAGLKFKMMLVPVQRWGPQLFTWAFLMLFLSASMCLFCLYHLWAGGNPYPRAFDP